MLVFRHALRCALAVFTIAVSLQASAEVNIYAGIIEPSMGGEILSRDPYIRFSATTSRLQTKPCCKVRLNYKNMLQEQPGYPQPEWLIVAERAISPKDLKAGTLFEIEPIIRDILQFNQQYSAETQEFNTVLLTRSDNRGAISDWLVELLLDDGSDEVIAQHEFIVHSRAIVANAADSRPGDEMSEDQSHPDSAFSWPRVPGLSGVSPDNDGTQGTSGLKVPIEKKQPVVGLPAIKITEPKSNVQIQQESVVVKAIIPDVLPADDCCEIFWFHQAMVNGNGGAKTQWNLIDRQRWNKNALKIGISYQWQEQLQDKAIKAYAGKPGYESQNKQFRGRQAQMWRVVVNPLPESIDKVKSDEEVIVLQPPETVQYD